MHLKATEVKVVKRGLLSVDCSDVALLEDGGWGGLHRSLATLVLRLSSVTLLRLPIQYRNSSSHGFRRPIRHMKPRSVEHSGDAPFFEAMKISPITCAAALGREKNVGHQRTIVSGEMEEI